MPKCKNCSYQFNKKDIYKFLIKPIKPINASINCSRCNSNHKLKTKSSIFTYLVFQIPGVLAFLYLYLAGPEKLLRIPKVVYWGIPIAWMSMIFLLQPFFIKLELTSSAID